MRCYGYDLSDRSDENIPVLQAEHPGCNCQGAYAARLHPFAREPRAIWHTACPLALKG